MTNKFTLITGASGGIGAEFAKALAKRKKNLILVARSKDKLQTLANDLKQEHGIKVELIAIDLSKIDGAEKLATACANYQIETLINNAGVGIGGRFANQDISRIETMLTLNILTLTKLTHLLLPQLKSNHGSIINVASTAAFQPVPYMAAYAATKAFVLSWSEALHAELKKEGVYVLALCPGATQTGFFDAAQMKKENKRLPMQSAPEVVSVALQAWDQRKAVVVSGWKNRLAVFSGRFVARSVIVRVSEWMMTGS